MGNVPDISEIHSHFFFINIWAWLNEFFFRQECFLYGWYHQSLYDFSTSSCEASLGESFRKVNKPFTIELTHFNATWQSTLKVDVTHHFKGYSWLFYKSLDNQITQSNELPDFTIHTIRIYQVSLRRHTFQRKKNIIATSPIGAIVDISK